MTVLYLQWDSCTGKIRFYVEMVTYNLAPHGEFTELHIKIDSFGFLWVCCWAMNVSRLWGFFSPVLIITSFLQVFYTAYEPTQVAQQLEGKYLRQDNMTISVFKNDKS